MATTKLADKLELRRIQAVQNIRESMKALGLSDVAGIRDQQIDRVILVTAKVAKDNGWTAVQFTQRLYIQVLDLVEMRSSGLGE